MIYFLTLELKMMNFDMGFLLSRPRKMSYLYIKLNLFGTDLILQLKINHGLVDIVVKDMF
jgi:hypothetical protein